MANLTSLRAGVIGTGFIGPVHIEALKRLGVQVTAVCGSKASAQAAADKWAISEIYGGYDYASLCESPNVDVVHIMRPTSMICMTGICSVAPSSLARATAASASWTDT